MYISNRLLMLLAIIVGVTILAGASSNRQADPPGQIIINADNLETARNLAEFFKERERQLREFVPVGTVIAFGAMVDPKHPPEGWLVCNGDAFDPTVYSELASLLPAGKGGTHRLPDMRGVFLRGMDMGRKLDPDGETRLVGEQQAWATGMPKIKFETTTDGAHTHSVKTDDINPGNWQSGGSQKPSGRDAYTTRTTSQSGSHDHKVRGGDAETRPVNVSVVYLIRCK